MLLLLLTAVTVCYCCSALLPLLLLFYKSDSNDVSGEFDEYRVDTHICKLRTTSLQLLLSILLPVTIEQAPRPTQEPLIDTRGV